jgi:hypothetical protein
MFVTGTDWALWTRWSNTSGGWSSWVSMGGTTDDIPPAFWNGSTAVQFGYGSYTPDLVLFGTNG